MTDLAHIRATLAARLNELEQRAKRIETDLTEPMSADSEEQASEMEDDAALATEDAMVIKEMASVRGAIGRIDAGHYGRCLSCGEEIAAARLAAMPEATLCTDCM